jgi:hypothetical protein
MKIRLTPVLRKESEGAAVSEVEVVAEVIEEAEEGIVEGIKEASVGRVGQANIAIQAIGPKTATIIIQIRLTINNIIRQALTVLHILNLLVLTHSLCRTISLQAIYRCLHLTLQCLTLHNILSTNLLTLVLFLVVTHILVFTLLNHIHSHLIMVLLEAMATGIQKVRQISVVPRKVESN